MDNSLIQREIKDNGFDYTTIAEASLNIVLLHHYWALQVYDANKKLIFFKSHPYQDNNSALEKGELPAELKNNSILEKDFREKKVLISTAKGTLIPKPFFSEALMTSYFKLNFGQPNTETLHHNYINSLDTYLLYSIPNRLANSLSHFTHVNHYYHVACPWLEGIMAYFKGSENRYLVIDIEDPLVRIAAFSGKQPEFFNIFRFDHDQDLLYYVLYAAQELNFDPHQTPFYFSGNLFQHSERFKMIYRYIRYPKLLIKPEQLTYSRKIEDLPDHYFFNILASPLCEL